MTNRISLLSFKDNFYVPDSHSDSRISGHVPPWSFSSKEAPNLYIWLDHKVKKRQANFGGQFSLVLRCSHSARCMYVSPRNKQQYNCQRLSIINYNHFGLYKEGQFEQGILQVSPGGCAQLSQPEQRGTILGSNQHVVTIRVAKELRENSQCGFRRVSWGVMGQGEAEALYAGFRNFLNIIFTAMESQFRVFEEGIDMIDYQHGTQRLPESSSCPMSKLWLDTECFVSRQSVHLSHFPATGVTHL